MRPTSCPNCEALVPARARECSRCGFRLLEDDWTGGPRISGPRGRTLALAAVLAAAAVAVVLVSSGGQGEGERADASGRPQPEVISNTPLTDRETERRLEERFTNTADDDTAAARCSSRDPRPAHAVRRCLVRYPNGTELTVLVVTNARGRELLGRILRD